MTLFPKRYVTPKISQSSKCISCWKSNPLPLLLSPSLTLSLEKVGQFPIIAKDMTNSSERYAATATTSSFIQLIPFTVSLTIHIISLTCCPTMPPLPSVAKWRWRTLGSFHRDNQRKLNSKNNENDPESQTSFLMLLVTKVFLRYRISWVFLSFTSAFRSILPWICLKCQFYSLKECLCVRWEDHSSAL